MPDKIQKKNAEIEYWRLGRLKASEDTTITKNTLTIEYYKVQRWFIALWCKFDSCECVFLI